MSDRTGYALLLPTSVSDRILRAAASAFLEDTCEDKDLKLYRFDDGRVCVQRCEVCLGSYPEFAEAIREAFDEIGERVPFSIVEYPCYEFTGRVYRWDPILGEYEADADTDGVPFVNENEVRRVLDSGASGAELVEWLRTQLGMAWAGEEALARL